MLVEIYLPREDSYLMERALNTLELKDKKVLEVGCGSGYLSIHCAKKKAIVSCLDINKDAINYTLENANKNKVKINAFQSNLFENVNEKYDLIFFNPPYLISDEIKYIALDGGKDGREIIDKFLEDFDKHLNENGIALLLHTDYNDLEKTKKILDKKGFVLEIITQEHLFFEELYILKLFHKII